MESSTRNTELGSQGTDGRGQDGGQNGGPSGHDLGEPVCGETLFCNEEIDIQDFGYTPVETNDSLGQIPDIAYPIMSRKQCFRCRVGNGLNERIGGLPVCHTVVFKTNGSTTSDNYETLLEIAEKSINTGR